ncbi:hypothetical protein ACFPZ0_21290 [Streptomonospora nanhaiensis]|uniref:DUF5067 domain-containing protein n=1 Tax=Streptomonospora nanhaiensis TaxID=1323731 RepID=A0A853BQV8_9ACTN|nr:hypothetical protein [Streptomonospora nanhaiensis]MBV2364335.1 hypothetical protein [Streptomonospora nanhaiensis]MBX9390590.1 hypothetical protein [Streptomonospora nanhaiensis]NYI97224.1 hypothetical protein [Streptomonospora nanhaiensis]
MRSPVRAVVPLMALAFLLSGCGLGGGEGQEAADDTGGGQEDGGGGGGSASTETTEVVAEDTWPYTVADGEAEVQIHALQVQGDLMHLTVTITAGDTGDGQDGASMYDLWSSFGAYPYLVDSVNLNRHEVVRAGNAHRLGPDVVETTLTFGEPREVSYTYAAPPEDVETMDLYAGSLPPVTGIPVQR